MFYVKKLIRYLSVFSVKIGILSGALMYLSYAAVHNQWSNLALIALSIFIAFFLPFFSRISNKIEEKIQFKTAFVTWGRLGRFVWQLTFNITVFFIFDKMGVIESSRLATLNGFLGVAFLTSLASVGGQFIALTLANREYGNKFLNITISLSFNIMLTALATMGVGLPRVIFVSFSYIFGGLVFIIGVFSDLRTIFPRRGGVGIFFGTFNPFHKTHLKIIKQCMQQRQLSKVYLHCTCIPKLHRDALDKGEIVIGSYENGMRVYEKTEKSDPHANYFPTGNRFYEYDTRKTLIELALQESKLADKIQVLDMPKTYERDGFYGIVSKVKKLHPNTIVHGIHGSDLGGMWVRNIYDESGWIYPFPVRRVDKVSATAIRNGHSGMTLPIIETILEAFKEKKEWIKTNKLIINLNNGMVTYEQQ